jgi:hypothetical protein
LEYETETYKRGKRRGGKRTVVAGEFHDVLATVFVRIGTGFHVHCKKRLTIFPSTAGMPLTKLSLVGNNLINLGQGEFGK